MLRTLTAALLLAVAAVPNVRAADLAYGSATLPKLSTDAQLVVEVKEISIAKQTDKVIIYSVKPTGTWKGTAPELVLVLCPTVDGTPALSEFQKSAIFLRGPLNAGQRRFWGIDVDMGDVYQLVSGRHGIVELDTAVRRLALHTYLSTADSKNIEAARLGWAQKNVKNGDLLLQESALYELERQADKQAALTTLTNTVTSGAPTTATYAVSIVGDSKLSAAVTALSRFAKNRKLSEPIRRQAVIELMERPDAAAELQKLMTTDAFVAATVKAIQVE